MTVVRLPKMGLSMEEGTIVRFMVTPGHSYNKGDILVEVETDKAVLEVEMPQDGMIEELLVQPGEMIQVGAPLVKLQGAQSVSQVSVQAEGAGVSAADVAAPVIANSPLSTAPLTEFSQNRDSRLIAISPSARRRARELGLDYKHLDGTGPNGRIIHRDIEEAAQQSTASLEVDSDLSPSTKGHIVQLSKMRRIIAKRMVQSVTTIPQFYIKRKVDLTNILSLKATVQKSINRSRNVKLSLNDFLIRAVAESLRSYPEFNASFIGSPDHADSHIVLHDHINIGLAVPAPNGLVVPVIHDADSLSVIEIASERELCVLAARNSALKVEDMQGGTFTISNLGTTGVEEFMAIVNPPEAGILAVGATVEEVRVINGKFVARPMMTMVGSFDHRVVDGMAAANFMKALVEQLESDDWLLL